MPDRSLRPRHGLGAGSVFDSRLHFGDAHHRAGEAVKLTVRGFDFWYGCKQALKAIDLDIYRHEVIAFMGPSGCGKSTLLRCLNRMNDTVAGARHSGTIHLDALEIHDPAIDLPDLRRRFGWVAQRPDPFPRSIYENVAYGPRIYGLAPHPGELDALVATCLRRAGLWDEVRDRLDENATDLSGGQQQRLCIARALSTGPEVLLMDEPCSAIDPVATAHIESLIDDLRADYTVVLITHNMQQAARISQRTAFFLLGELVEVGDTQDFFTSPRDERSNDYITGRFG